MRYTSCPWLHVVCDVLIPYILFTKDACTSPTALDYVIYFPSISVDKGSDNILMRIFTL